MNRTSKENEILRTLKNTDGALTEKQIIKETGLNAEETREMIYDLWTQGLIEATGIFYTYSKKLRKMQEIAEQA